MIEAEVLLKYSIFIDILDSAKNFSLASQYKDIDIILPVVWIDDTKLSYQLCANKFKASPESIFEVPHMKKVLTQIVHNENSEFYQGIKLKNFHWGKKINQKQRSIISKFYHFVFGRAFWWIDRGLGEHQIETRVSWVLPDEISVNSDNFVDFLKAQLESVEIIFNGFKEKFLVTSNISLTTVKKEDISIIIYTLNHLNPLVSEPRQFWKLLYEWKTLRHGIKHFSFLSCAYVYLTVMQHLKGFSAKSMWWIMTGKINWMKKI